MTSSKLMVKNIPSDFSDGEKCEFLNLFGGTEVVSLGFGKMKNCCYVSFPDNVTAKQALEALHQFQVLGQRLVVEYAKPAHEQMVNQIQSRNAFQKKVFINDTTKKKESDIATEEKDKQELEEVSAGIAPKLNINHDFPSHLSYKYPEPSVTILTNIANALATVPKFYTQVLHLMNKMNLPPPFSGPTLTPPLPGDSVSLQDACVDTTDLHEFASSDESELESDSESNQKHTIYQGNQVTLEPVRKRKRLKAVAKANQEKFNVLKPKTTDTSVQSLFELASSSKRLEFKLASSIQEAVDRKSQPPVHYSVFDERGAFGKIEPVRKEAYSSESEEEEEDNEETEPSEHISLKQLKENRIPEMDILAMAQFKNYNPGKKTNRLYIKNLAKQVVEEDLNFIFKRFTKSCTKDEKISLEIRLMQEGRMKGQAFITFPSEDIAEKALKSVHGYVLHDKPMVIQYGRSGKQKE